MTIDLHKIKDNKLFAGLSDSEIEKITLLLKLETYRKGDLIIKRGDRKRKVFLIVKGNAQVQISDRDNKTVPLKILTRKDFFGEMSFFSKDAKRTADVIAISDIALLTLDEKTFDLITAQFPTVIKNILINAITELQDSNRRVLERFEIERDILEQRVRERTEKLVQKNRQLEEKNNLIHRQLMLAQNIQKKFLPPESLMLPGLSLKTMYIPCEELGGDLCGVIQLNERLTAIYAGDVSGHGVSSALITVYLKQLIDNLSANERENGITKPRSPGEVLSLMNNAFMDDINGGDPGLYFTIFYFIFDRRELSVSYSSAGIHCPPVYISNGNASLLFERSDYPIGFVKDNEYKTETLKIERGSSLLCVSDGVIETFNGKECFGMDRLLDTIRTINRSSMKINLMDINKKVDAFRGNSNNDDDICYLLIEFL